MAIFIPDIFPTSLRECIVIIKQVPELHKKPDLSGIYSNVK